MNKIIYAAALVVLTGCGLSEDKYNEESIRLSCEFIIECYADAELYDSVDACITELTDELQDPASGCEPEATTGVQVPGSSSTSNAPVCEQRSGTRILTSPPKRLRSWHSSSSPLDSVNAAPVCHRTTPRQWAAP